MSPAKGEIKNNLPDHNPDKPEPKRNWLVREIPNSKSQIPNKFKIPNSKLQTKKVEKKISVCQTSIVNCFQTCEKIFCQKVAGFYD
jgi:hypothetical protein